MRWLPKASCMVLFIHAALQGLVVVGHRGACGHAPENALASFEKAIELGVDMIELDVRLCTSGELVVIHDKRVDRTTNGHGLVSEKTLVQLQQLDAGDGQQIPTLRRVFDCVNRRVKIDIEMKEPVAREVAQLIEEYVQEKGWECDDFLVTSYDHNEVKLFKQLCPAVPTGAIISGVPVRFASFVEDANADVVIAYNETINPAMIENTHERGKQIFVFTVNESAEIKQLIDWGVDGIISDFPDRVLKLLW